MTCISRPSTGCYGTSKPRRGSQEVHGRLGDIYGVIRSSPLVGLCYDAQHGEAMLLSVLCLIPSPSEKVHYGVPGAIAGFFTVSRILQHVLRTLVTVFDQ